MVRERRPPKMMAPTCTPWGSSHDGSSAGLLIAGAVNRLLGCAALRPQSGVHFCPVQSMHSGGGSLVLASHQTSPSGNSATLVKIALRFMHSIALGLDW